jgi:AAA+ superfamily predicted ATPase
MRRQIKRRQANSVPIHPIYIQYRALIHYWMLQILVPFGGHKGFISDRFCSDDDVLDELGLSHLTQWETFDSSLARHSLKRLHQELQSSPADLIPANTQLATNINWLAEVIGLTEVEQHILVFRVIASRHLQLRKCLGYLSIEFDLIATSQLIGKLLGASNEEVEGALKPGARLTSTGLICFSPKLGELMDKFGLLTGLADNLLIQHQSHYSLFKNNFTHASASSLTDQDYPHLREDISLLRNYLTDALENGRQGVNILIYGTPGSGKTEFVKMLAEQLERPLFEIASENIAGEPIKSANRFRSYRLSQHILATDSSRPIVLFDEIEDVFRTVEDEDERESKWGGNRSGIKAWINKLLEGNPIPSFWLSNNIGCLDNAFVRRFDYVIELNAPPRSVRHKILDQYLAGIGVSSKWRSYMAEHEYLNPAVVERAAKVIEIAKQREPELAVEKALERMLGNTLEAMGLPRTPRNSVQSSANYRLDILNTDRDLTGLCNGLLQHGEGRLCLYGPPGTGKSAFGKHLAEALDRPLLLRRASDILSPYLCITERNMARMFCDASQENAVLLA